MCLLNEKQIAIVISDVESAGINFSHLSTDLIDHICCDIESLMNQDIPFENAYEQIKEEFGIIGLRQIQQNTLMLIDKNYRIMKKSMKLIGVMAMSLMAFGALFKIMHWPGASIVLTLSFFFTTLVFFPALLLIMHKEANNKKQAVLYIASFIGGAGFMVGVLFKIMHWPGAHMLIFIGISLLAYLVLPMILVSKLRQKDSKPGILLLGISPLIIYVTGILFKINHWPGANILLTVGSIILILVFIPIYYRTNIRKSTYPRVDFLFSIIALSYFVIFSFLLQMNLSRSAQKSNEFQSESFKQTALFINDANQKMLNGINDTSLMEILHQSEKLTGSIQELKISIIKENNKTDKTSAMALLNTNNPLVRPYTNIGSLLPANHPNSPIAELDKQVDSFLLHYNTHAHSETELTNHIIYFQSLLDDFKYQHAESALKLLSLFEYELQLINYSLIKSTINQNLIK